MKMDTLADFEPLDYYKSRLKAEFEKNANEYFDELVKRSGVDAAENAAIVAKYDAAQKKAEEAGKKLSSGKTLRSLAIAGAVVAFLAAFILIILFTDDTYWLYLFFGILCIIIGVGAIALICTKLKKLVEARQKKYEKALAAAGEIKQQAMEQMRPLHALFTWNMTRELVLKVMPDFTLDDRLDVKKLDLFIGKYGFRPVNADMDSSTVYLLSGTIDNSPFLFERRFRHSTVTKTYTGTLTIHWTTYSTDSKGNTRAVHHSQVLTASVGKPAPAYTYETLLYYGNEAAPDLHFSRTPKYSHMHDEKEREKFIKSGSKRLEKLTQSAVTSGNGGGFTELANTEFEVLFGATNRNNEVQFRLMFTPLAQNNMVDLMTSDDGYGDDFAFYKTGMLNCIRSDHAQSWQTDADPARYMSYDLKASRAAFVAYNAEYFKSMYFDFAPLLSVPLYQMTKPREYIYRDVYPSNYTEYEAEATANRFNVSQFAPPEAKTDSILKASFIRKDGTADKMAVTAYSFDTVPRVDYVDVFGGDGLIHAVPVPWTEYIPVSRTSEMEIKAVDGTRENYESLSAGSELASFVRRFSSSGASAFCDGLVGIPLTDGDFTGNDDKALGEMFGLKAAAAGTAAFIAGAEAVKAAADMLDEEDKKAERKAPGAAAAEAAAAENITEQPPESGETGGDMARSTQNEADGDGNNAPDGSDNKE